MRRTLAWLAAVLVVMCGGVLVYSGLEKLQDVRRFGIVLSSHEIMPSQLVETVAYVVPLAEVAAGAIAIGFLAQTREPRASLRLLAIVFTTFGVYATLLVAKPPSTPTTCGCSIRVGFADWTSIAFADFGLALIFAVSAFAGFSREAC